MAREWSRRSIEEIARKIGKGLGGENFESLISGGYTNTTTEFNVFNSESQKYESSDGVLVRPFVKLTGITFNGTPYINEDTDGIFLCYLPYRLNLNIQNSSPWAYSVDMNRYTDSFLPFVSSFLNTPAVIRNNPKYYVALVNRTGAGKNTTPTRLVNFDDYTADELDMHVLNHYAVVDANNPFQRDMTVVSLWMYGSKAQDVYDYLSDQNESILLTVFKKDGV